MTAQPLPIIDIHFGDNLQIIRGFRDASFPLIHIDPPFNRGKVPLRTQIRTLRDEQGDRGGSTGSAPHDFRSRQAPTWTPAPITWDFWGRGSRKPAACWLCARWPYQSLEQWKSEARDSNPLQKEYADNDTRAAAEDAAWILFELWGRPIWEPLYFRRCRCKRGWFGTGEGIVWDPTRDHPAGGARGTER